MKNFAFVRARSVKEAVLSLGTDWNEAAVMGGGTDLIGEMKNYVHTPNKVVNLRAVPDLKYIKQDGNLIKIGALTSIAAVETDTLIKSNFAALSKAASLVASPQLRNMGTIAGNICQRPRCWYYRDSGIECLRKGGRLCYAMVGENKYHAVLGGLGCYIVHPSDTAVSFTAFDAKIKIAHPDGEKEVNIEEFFVLPEDDLNRENILKPNEIVTEISVPIPENGTKSTFIKVQERGVWDFAVAGVAVSLKLDGNRCDKARIVLGAAAPIPWRSLDAEKELEGRTINEETAQRAADASVYNNMPMTGNAYKVQLFKNIVKRAILELV
ncbi:hypothetical protein AMJ80_07190 [bacterium SM23_31]|nr:MAG: hypothetical protein AMJ80_07190 [bacterium SM23_31]